VCSSSYAHATSHVLRDGVRVQFTFQFSGTDVTGPTSLQLTVYRYLGTSYATAY
jgi:hypothetical protein